MIWAPAPRITVVGHGRRVQLVLLDTGLTVNLRERERNNFRAVFSAVVRGESAEAARLFTIDQAHLSEEAIDGFSAEFATVIDRVASQSLAEVRVGEVLSSLLALGRKYHGMSVGISGC